MEIGLSYAVVNEGLEAKMSWTIQEFNYIAQRTTNGLASDKMNQGSELQKCQATILYSSAWKAATIHEVQVKDKCMPSINSEIDLI